MLFGDSADREFADGVAVDEMIADDARDHFGRYLDIGDLIVFTGGIGEHNSRLRRRVCENFSYLGLKFDYEANTAFGEDAMLSLPDSKVKVALITTDEEIVIARDTMHIVMSEEEN